MRRAIAILAPVLGLSGGAAQAFSCQFTTECYEAETCGAAEFEIDVDVDGQTVSTTFGDLTIVAVKESPALTTLFATGPGAEYLLSVTPDAARFTSQVNEGPQVISYLGLCEGVFP